MQSKLADRHIRCALADVLVELDHACHVGAAATHLERVDGEATGLLGLRRFGVGGQAGFFGGGNGFGDEVSFIKTVTGIKALDGCRRRVSDFFLFSHPRGLDFGFSFKGLPVIPAAPGARPGAR